MAKMRGEIVTLDVKVLFCLFDVMQFGEEAAPRAAFEQSYR